METRKRKGFTLIELLVVVAIIAVLAAMLLPALSQAREKARQAVCMNNMKHLYLATWMYTNDYDEYLPFTEAGTGISKGACYGALSDQYTLAFFLIHKYLYPGRVWIRGMTSNVGKSNGPIYYCPSQPRKIHGGYFNWNLTSYSVNRYWGYGTSTYNRWTKISREPYDKDIFFWEEPAGTPGPADRSGATENPRRNHVAYPHKSYGPDDRIFWVHSGGSNIIYGDGHLEWFSATSCNWTEYPHPQ